MNQTIHFRGLAVAAALLGAGAPAIAQSSVTLSGIVDAAVTHGRGSTARRLQLTNSGYNSSRLALRGVEDLGGGLTASFWLEGGLANDDGQGGRSNTNNQPSGAGNAVAGLQGLTFNRRSTVSLSAPWGELRLGRDHTPQFWNLQQFDPFGVNGVGTSQAHLGAGAMNGPTQVRASNSVGYFLPSGLGGVYGQAMVYFGENLRNGAATERDGTGAGVRIGYAAGPLNVAAATSSTRYASGDVHQSNVGAHWAAAGGRIMGMIERDRAGAATGRGWVFGGVIPFAPGEIRGSVSRYTAQTGPGAAPRTTKVALGYVHHLSKRTAAYATLARVTNANGASVSLGGSTTAANGSSSGLDLGIRHSF